MVCAAVLALCASALLRPIGAIRLDVQELEKFEVMHSEVNTAEKNTITAHALGASHQKAAAAPVRVTDIAQQQVDICTQKVDGGKRRNSAWRRFDKCKCENRTYVVQCATPNECTGSDNNKLTRYYKESLDLASCRCGQSSCDATCDEVPGGEERESAWRRTLKCKCPVDHIITGDDPACQGTPPARYYSIQSLWKRGCACTHKDATTTVLTTTTTAGTSVLPKENHAVRWSSLKVTVLALTFVLEGLIHAKYS